ncbi:MAG: hypothetical protein ACE5JV_00695 [Nitrososphaerales archaeon]
MKTFEKGYIYYQLIATQIRICMMRWGSGKKKDNNNYNRAEADKSSMLQLKFLGMRSVPKLVVYNHAAYPEEEEKEEVRRAPLPNLGMVLKVSPPSLERVAEEEKVVAKTKKKKAEKPAE